ncbi:GDSL-type esterase/lipase family protein [Eubacteriaceae bacterium ES2]|nr:GDSL-type esterase/lipase family protein [Eubacteriaceae bacterium ES2]
MKKNSITKIGFLLVFMVVSLFLSGNVFAAGEIVTDSSEQIQAQYRGHIQNKGDVPATSGMFMAQGQELGSTGEGLRLEGIVIELSGDVPVGASITYQVHVQNKGWMEPVSNGELAGTTGESLQIEAIKINLEGLDNYDVYYRGHIQNEGNQPTENGQWLWAKNGEELGTTGQGLRLEAIEIKIVEKNNDVALGDSIAYGMSANPGLGYVDLFYNNLSTIEGNESLTLYNEGIPGITSSELLTQLQINPEVMQELANAEVVTISIGGNNLLQPLIAGVAEAFGLDPTAETFASDLVIALQDPNAQATINAVLPQLQTNLIAGATQFSSDFPQIIAAVRTLAPEANIYVATLYNPLSTNDPLYSQFEQIIEQMNVVILTPDTGYLVADVYSAFNNYEGSEPLVNFNWTMGQIDPHPTTIGHSLIYQTHLEAQLITTE